MLTFFTVSGWLSMLGFQLPEFLKTHMQKLLAMLTLPLILIAAPLSSGPAMTTTAPMRASRSSGKVLARWSASGRTTANTKKIASAGGTERRQPGLKAQP